MMATHIDEWQLQMFASKSSNDVKWTRVHHMGGWRTIGMDHEKLLTMLWMTKVYNQ